MSDHYFIMYFLYSVLAVTNLLCTTATAKSVFAHVVVGNTAAHTVETWTQDIQLAQAAGIDAFALNICPTDTNTPAQVANAFQAAQAASGFGLFFSFDYLGSGSPWPADGDNSVVSYLTKYGTSAAYFKNNGALFVSTFEGIANIADWAPGGSIRSKVTTPIYFVPNWDGAGPDTVKASLANMEGFFSWNMWPNGPENMTDSGDMSWKATIGAGTGSTNGTKTFMMGVSPWFFHSGDGAGSWVWRGDNLWHDRWMETLDVNPDFVEIVTWNDFGEASYIGPIHDESEVRTASQVYCTAQTTPHEGFLNLLPYYIAKYKGQTPTIAKNQMQFWYRNAPVAAGDPCGVVGNGAGQTQYTPKDLLEDNIFFSALLTAPAQVTVKIGDGPVATFSGQQGINHWSTPFSGQTGVPVFSILGGSNGTVATGQGTPIVATVNGCANYNAYVGGF